MSERDLISRARAGDRDAFTQLWAGVERPLAAFLYRLTADRQDAEDLMQEVAVEALETIERFAGASSFRAWVFRFAARASLEYLGPRPPWSPDAQLLTGQQLGDQAGERNRLHRLHNSRIHTTYQIREHIDFCFTCMGRTLLPHEAAALLLVEVHGFSLAEAAEVLEAPAESIRFRVDQARQTLIEHFDARCSLINRAGSCAHCSGFDTWLHGDRRHTEEALFHIDLQPAATARERAQTFDQRLQIIRPLDPILGEGAIFHDSLMTFLREVSHY